MASAQTELIPKEPPVASPQPDGESQSGVTVDELLEMLANSDREMSALRTDLDRMREWIAKLTANQMALEMGLNLRTNVRLDVMPAFLPGVAQRTWDAWKAATLKILKGEHL